MKKRRLRKRVTLLMALALIISQICVNTNVVFADDGSTATNVSTLEEGTSPGDSEQIPEEDPEEGPETDIDEDSEEEPEETPENTPERPPEETPEETPEASPEATPEEIPEESPESTPEATPETSPEASPEATPGATPEATPIASPEATPMTSPSASPVTSPSASPMVSPSASPMVSPSATPMASPSAKPKATPKKSHKEKETIDLNVTVTWDDELNAEETRPEEVTITIQDGSGSIVSEAIVTGEKEEPVWEYTFTNLPKYVTSSEDEEADEEEAEETEEVLETEEVEETDEVLEAEENEEDSSSSAEEIQYSISGSEVEGYEFFVEDYNVIYTRGVDLLALEFDPDADFFYYTDEAEKYSCSAEEINDVIKEAESGTTFELNKDVKLESSIVFDNSKEYTLNLKGNALKGPDGARAVTLLNVIKFTIENGTIKEADTRTATGSNNKKGAAIYFENSALVMKNVIIADNVAGSQGGGIYGSKGTFIAINSNVSNNAASYDGCGIHLVGTETFFENCEVSENNSTGSQGGTGGIYAYNSPITANNLRVISNGKNSELKVGAIQANMSSINLTNSLIEGNEAKYKSGFSIGGIYIGSKGEAILNNTIVRGNQGYGVGGIGTDNYNAVLTVNGGAIYNNNASTPYTATFYANDLCLSQGNGTSFNIPAAAEMMNDESYYWSYTSVYAGKDTYKEHYAPINIGDGEAIDHLFNVSNEPSKSVAELLKEGEAGQRYETISEAIQNAADGDTIKLVANGAITETVTLSEVKSIIFDLNSRTWSGDSEASKALILKEGASVTIKGNGTLNDVSHGGESLVLDSAANISAIYLETDKFVQVGPNFPKNAIAHMVTFVLSTEGYKNLNTQDVVLMKTANDLSDEIIRKIEIRDADSLVTIMANDEGNIIARKMSGVFVDGQKGNDSNSGLSIDSPVKTFARAKEVFESLPEEGKKKAEGIFVTGTITVTGNEEWSLPEGVSLLRYKAFTEYLVNVNGGELTLKNITIDGQGDKVEAGKAIIRLGNVGILNIKEGAKLINNRHSKQTPGLEDGGAIYCVSGRINMSDGEILDNTAGHGGAINLYSTEASMVLDGGYIKNNTARRVGGFYAAGGGVSVMQGAKLIMNGGEVSSNKSLHANGSGGGIAVGTPDEEDFIGSTFIMNGGKIDSNTADVIFGDGGGVYVECESKATINAGEITNNSCGSSSTVSSQIGAYGGGGIYVNGGRNGYEDGKLYMPNGVYISGNTAGQLDGSAIAGCGTSTVYIYPYSATIYQNNGLTQVYVDSTKSTGYGTRAKIFISEFAQGGGINHWTDENGAVPSERLQNLQPETRLEISNPNAENLDTTGKLAPVKITGNSSMTLGGGIGTNGYVAIGKKADEPEFVTIEGSKEWNDNNNQDGIRPTEITIYLLANGEKINNKVVTELDDWKWSFTNLPEKDAAGQKIVYTIEEEPVKDYTSEVKGYNVTNTHVPGTVNVDGSKTWNDNNNQDGIRPTSITIRLFADGKQIDSKVVTAADDWKWSFVDLPKYKAGKEVVYTIEEVPVKDYTSEVKGYNVTNTHVPGTVNVDGSKTWNDNNNQDGIRPTSITIRLFADGKQIDSKVVTAADDWKWSFTNLPKRKVGKEVVYTIDEVPVKDYTSEVEGYNVTNTHVPEEPKPTATPKPTSKPEEPGKPSEPSNPGTPEQPRTTIQQPVTPENNQAVKGAERTVRGADRVVKGANRRTGEDTTMVVVAIAAIAICAAVLLAMWKKRSKDSKNNQL